MKWSSRTYLQSQLSWDEIKLVYASATSIYKPPGVRILALGPLLHRFKQFMPWTGSWSDCKNDDDDDDEVTVRITTIMMMMITMKSSDKQALHTGGMRALKVAMVALLPLLSQNLFVHTCNRTIQCYCCLGSKSVELELECLHRLEGCGLQPCVSWMRGYYDCRIGGMGTTPTAIGALKWLWILILYLTFSLRTVRTQKTLSSFLCVRTQVLKYVQ